MSDFFPLSIEADRVRPITPEYGLLRGECWTTVPLPPPAGLFVPLRPKPTDIPIEQATKFEFILNVKAAKALSLNISDDVLSLADGGDRINLLQCECPLLAAGSTGHCNTTRSLSAGGFDSHDFPWPLFS